MFLGCGGKSEHRRTPTQACSTLEPPRYEATALNTSPLCLFPVIYTNNCWQKIDRSRNLSYMSLFLQWRTRVCAAGHPRWHLQGNQRHSPGPAGTELPPPASRIPAHLHWHPCASLHHGLLPTHRKVCMTIATEAVCTQGFFKCRTKQPAVDDPAVPEFVVWPLLLLSVFLHTMLLHR